VAVRITPRYWTYRGVMGVCTFVLGADTLAIFVLEADILATFVLEVDILAAQNVFPELDIAAPQPSFV
jgi:hypothetical protein